MIYVDTNVFLYAVEHHPVYGDPCGLVLQDIESGELNALCSRLVLVEFVHVLARLNRSLKREKERFDVHALTEALLALVPNWAEIDDIIVKTASRYTFRVSPPDYFHLATMEVNGVTQVVSADNELDRVDWVERVDPRKYAEL